MALIASATYGSYPGMKYEFYAEQTGGSGNSRTIKLTLKLKCGGSSSSSWYGYAVNWRGYVNGTWSSWATVKGTESWNATQDFRTYTTTITTNVGTTSSKAINVGFATDSQIDADWDFSKTNWSFTVGATNRAPSAPSNLAIRTGAGAASLSGIIPENINYFYIDWSAASDADGDTIYYDLQEQRNGGSWTSIDGSGTDCAHGFNTTGGEGTSYRYWVDARDSKGVHSSSGVYSATITKNVLTAGNFTGHSNDINFDTNEFTLNFNRGSNTNGGAVYNMCYSDNITVYNATEISSGNSQTIKIWRSGATPSGPYIKFDDLKNYFAGSSYNGRLHVGLRTRNDFGTYKYSGGSIGVDLRVAPNPAMNQAISTDTNHSPIYKKVAFSNNYYFIPDGSNVCRVHWNLGSGKLGESVRYEVYVSYNNGGWQKLADVEQGTSNYAYYNHVIPKQTYSQQFKYLIRTITNYGWYSDAITSAQTLHFYNTPSIAVGTLTRGATTCDVKITVKTNTSIPNVSTVGSWRTEPTASSGNLNASQSEQNIAVSGLTDAGTYTLKVSYNDNTGFSGNQVRDIAIGQNTPIFLVNKFGVGVNGYEAHSSASLSVKGNTYTDTLNVADTVRIGGNNKPNLLVGDDCWLGDCNEENVIKITGNQDGGKGMIRFGNGAKIGYNGGTAFDIFDSTWINGELTTEGAVKTPRISIKGVHGENGFQQGEGDNATWDVCNFDIRAWWGMGIKDYAGVRRIVFNSRDGSISTRGYIHAESDLRVGNRLYFTNTTNDWNYYATANWYDNRHCIDVPNLTTNKVISKNGIMISGDNVWTQAGGSVWGFEPNRTDVGRTRLANGSYHGSLSVEGYNPWGTHNFTYMFATGYFYPNANQELGASSGTGRWGQIYSTKGSVSTSDSRVKENIKSIAKSNKTRTKNSAEGATSLDMWNYVKGTKTYTFNYKTKYLAEGAKNNTMMGILADEIPDAVFANIGLMSKTEQEYQDELKRQEELTKVYEEEIAKVPATLALDTDKEEATKKEYDINGDYGNEIIEGTGLTRRELKREVEKEIEEPVRMINSSSQIAMLQEVLSMALNKIEELEERIQELEAGV